MEKKYRLKTQEVTAKNSGLGDMYYLYKGGIMIGKLPLFLLEQSNDWELIEDKPIITHDFYIETSDGVTITDGHQLVYTIDLHENLRTLTARSVNPWTKGLKIFSSAEARSGHVKSLRPHFEITTHDGVVITDPNTQVCYVNNNGRIYNDSISHWGRYTECWIYYSTDKASEFSASRKPYFEFITEDGEKVVTENHKLNSLYLPMWEERMATPAYLAKFLLEKDKWKFFYHRDNLLKYIEEHKPKPKVLFITADGIEVTDPTTLVCVAGRIDGKWIAAAGNTCREYISAKEYIDLFGYSEYNYGMHNAFMSRQTRDKWIQENNPKKVILTTQDGIDITDPEQYLYYIHSEWKVDSFKAGKLTNVHNTVKIFSSEAKRDEYILNSKPLLNLTEVKSALNDSYGYFKNSHQARRVQVEKLTELAKSKL